MDKQHGTNGMVWRFFGEQLFYKWHNVLQVSSGLFDPGYPVWYLVVAQAVVILSIFLALVKGIKSAGKVVYMTATAPYILLTVLLVRGVTLPGAKEGILFYLTPDFKRLLAPNVWVEAAQQVFFSLGPAWGALITMSSYNHFDNNCFRDSFILSFLGEGTSFFAGFAIFSILGYMAHSTGVSVDKVVSSGPGLAFIAYPEALALLPLPHLWSVLFFIMIITLVMDTQLASLETVMSALCDSFPHTLGRRRLLVTGAVCLLTYVTNLSLITQGGVYMFQLVDWFFGVITFNFVAFNECIAIAWIYGANRFEEDIQMMTGRKPPKFIKILWAFVIPVLLAVLLVVTLVGYEPPVYGDYQYDGYGRALGWIIALVSFVPIPAVAIYTLAMSEGNLWQRFKKTTTPTTKWGPADSTLLLKYRTQVQQRLPRRRLLDGLH